MDVCVTIGHVEFEEIFILSEYERLWAKVSECFCPFEPNKMIINTIFMPNLSSVP